MAPRPRTNTGRKREVNQTAHRSPNTDKRKAVKPKLRIEQANNRDPTCKENPVELNLSKGS